MIPTRLNLYNFLAYRAPNPVVFEGIQLACLTGENGAGKSSLLDAMTWALWGKARTNRDNDLINLSANRMHVELDFLHEGQLYRVARSRERRGRSGAGGLQLFIFTADNQLSDISESAIKDTQNKINQILRLDYETFVNSAFLQQGQADAFTVKRPADRKQILSNILGLEVWERYEEVAKEKHSAANKHFDVLTMRIEDINRDLEEEPQLQRNLEEASAAHEAANTQLEIAEKLLKEVANAPTELRNAQDNQRTTQTRRANYERELNEVREGIARRQQDITGYQAILAQREEIEAGYQTLEAARTASEELNRKFKQLTDFDKRISALQGDLNTEQTRLEGEVAQLEAQITRLTEQVNSVNAEALAELQQQIADLEAKSVERETLQAKVGELREEDANLQGTNERLRETMNELKERINTLENVAGADCPLCGQPLDDDHRAELLKQLQEQGTEQGDTFRANKTRMETIQDEMQVLNEQVAVLVDDIQQLPKLQQQAGKLEEQVAAAARAEADMRAAEQSLAEVRERLETGAFGGELRTRIADLIVERDALGYSESEYDAHQNTLDEYKGYMKRYTDLAIADKTLPNLEEAQTSAEAREKRLIEAIDAVDIELTQIAVDIERLTVLKATFDSRTAEAMRLRTAEREANNRVVTAQQGLNALKIKREQRQQYIEQRQTIAEERAIFEQLRTAFGKKGVPAMIIDAAIPELEFMTNDLLTRMTDGRMAVRFSTQREKVTGGTAETFDISISDEQGTRSYELYSGGEAFRINFAIRVALSKLLARRAGAHLETLFIDEGFGTQDTDGRTKLVEAINTIREDFDLILVITHIDELKDAFPVHINVEKTSSGSQVQIR